MLAAPAASADSPVLGKDSSLTVLANGLTVLIRADSRFPVVSTRLYVHAGSAFEKPEWAGISHLLEHMVFKGTARRPKGAISQAIEAAGGYLNAATSFDYTVYINDLPARHWKLGMDVAADMAFHAALEPDELASEKEVVVAELKRGKDNPHSELFQALQAAVLAKTPYSRPIIGFEKTIRAITPDDIRAYIREYYQPRNMLLTVVGDVDPKEVLAEAERVFGGYGNTGAMAAVQPLDAASLGIGAPLVSIHAGPWNKVYFAMGIPVPGSGDYENLALDMLAGLLGGDATALFPRIYKYERGLVDSISVSNVSFERVGMLTVMAQLDADKVPEFWAGITKDLAGLKASLFTPREIDRVRLNMEERLVRARETVSGLASHLGYFQFFLGGEQGEINMMEALRNVDEKALQRAIDTWIAPRRLAATLLAQKDAGLDAQELDKTLAVNWPPAVNVRADAAAAAQASEVVDLGKGRKVVLIPDASLPHVALTLTFSGGEALLTPDEQGLASLTARSLTTGTQARAREALDAYVSDRAGAVSASPGRLNFSVSLRGPARFNDELLNLFSDIINHPAFEPAEVAREKNVQLAAIRTTEDSPMGLAFRRLPPFLFPGSVFGYQPLGTADKLAGFTPGQVSAFWEKQRARPWVLAVAGSFDKARILEFASTLPVPEEPAVMPAAPRWSAERSLVLQLANRKQAHFLLIFPTAPRTSPDTPGLCLMEEALGGMGGPLFGRLRDEMGLGYTVNVFNVQNEALGYMAFYIGTDPDRLHEAEAGFRKIIGDLREKLLPQADLERGLSHWEGEYYRSLQKLDSRAAEAAQLTLEGFALDERRKRIEQARGVTAEDLKALALKYLNPDAEYRIMVLPVEQKN